jgi:protein-tyrosine-phosphatase/ubiquinone/menaquinone biosynthesis C-methylase UbiE
MDDSVGARRQRLLFVCVENSNRSQMAEAFARLHGGDRVEAFSAGSRPSGRVNPRALEFMREVGCDLALQRSKSLAELPAEEFDVVVGMGCGDQGCPLVPARRREEWGIPDPKDLPADQYRAVRDLIEQKVKALLAGLEIAAPRGEDPGKAGQGYVLGQSTSAARRLEIQDAHFAEPSERLLDDLALRPDDRVVELGCGAGSFSRRILRRLGAGGVLVGVDRTEGLLAQARTSLSGVGPARFEPVLADVAGLGPWLDGAAAVVGRTMLHHIPMVEFMLGRLRAAVRPGTRFGFLEPDFRTPLARLAYLEATGRQDLAPLHVWAVAINQLYLGNRLSPAVGATLARALETAGCRRVRAAWMECPSDETTTENMLMFYDEVRDRLEAAGILTAVEIQEQQRLLRALPSGSLPPVWGIHWVACEA